MIQQSDGLGFIYSFDLSKEINGFKQLSEGIRSDAEAQIVDVIYESFVITGDHDYLMARLLAQKGLPRGFYWAASQAVEKYLKAFLLMNGESVKSFGGHPLKSLFIAAGQIDTIVASLNIQPHINIDVEKSVSHLLRKFSAVDFIDEIEKHGNADNRYNTFGVEYNTGHLYALDSFSFQLRNKIGAIPINESFKNLSSDLILVFEKNNPWFHPCDKNILTRVPSSGFPIQEVSNVTKLEILVKNKDNPAYKIALQWLKEKMKLPKI